MSTLHKTSRERCVHYIDNNLTVGALLLKSGVADGAGDLVADSAEVTGAELRLPVRDRGVW